MKRFLSLFLVFSLFVFSCKNINLTDRSNLSKPVEEQPAYECNLDVSDITSNNATITMKQGKVSNDKFKYYLEIRVKKEYDAILEKHVNIYEADKSFFYDFFKDEWRTALLNRTKSGDHTSDFYSLIEKREGIPGNSYVLTFYVVDENADLVKNIYVNGKKIDGNIFCETFTLLEQDYTALPDCDISLSSVDLLPQYGASVTLSGGESGATYFVAMESTRFIDSYLKQENGEKVMIYKILEAARSLNEFPPLYKSGDKVTYYVSSNFNRPRKFIIFKYSHKNGLQSKIKISDEFKVKQ